MTWWQAIVIGVVEGITEYLPVSSTGHLILTTWLLGLDRPEHKAALDAYLVVVQGGAILAVLGLYWPRVVQMLRGLGGRDPEGLRLAAHIALAFLPAAIVGVLLDDVIKAFLFRAAPVLAALAAGGVWMIWLGRNVRPGGDVTTLSAATALGIGCFQVLALWPGTSRSMVTIAGAMILRLNPVAAAEFSFLLGVPTLGAACLHDLVGNLRAAAQGNAPSMIAQFGAGHLALGFAVATLSAGLAVRWLVGFLTRSGLAPFGWYRLWLAALLSVLSLGGVVQIE